ncbi:hypothetical protein [Kineococcus glutinatus]|uniref:Septum formation-related domain-containing protein n=1 Tax=Kineococcus glutinatus TaxID=1070872 RepID=A0ABP9HEU1_9ACTN
MTNPTGPQPPGGPPPPAGGSGGAGSGGGSGGGAGNPGGAGRRKLTTAAVVVGGVLAAIAAVVEITTGSLDLIERGSADDPAPPAATSAPAATTSTRPPEPSSPDSGASDGGVAALAVGTCLTAADTATVCSASHQGEVFATGSCDTPTLVAYLGGRADVDVLGEALQVRELDVAGGTACVVGSGNPVTGSFANTLQEDVGDAWRRCHDSRTGQDVACSVPHTAEYTHLSAGGPQDVDCVQVSADYTRSSYQDLADRLRVERATPDGESACLLVVRGSRVLTASVRDLGSAPLPLG